MPRVGQAQGYLPRSKLCPSLPVPGTLEVSASSLQFGVNIAQLPREIHIEEIETS